MAGESRTSSDVIMNNYEVSLQQARSALVSARLACDEGRYDDALAALSLGQVFFHVASQLIPGKQEAAMGMRECEDLKQTLHQRKADSYVAAAERAARNGDYSTAREHCIRAQEWSRNPEIEARLEQLRSLEARAQRLNELIAQGKSFGERGDYARAETTYEEALQLAESAASSPLSKQVRQVLSLPNLYQEAVYNQAKMSLEQIEDKEILDESSRKYLSVAEQLLRARYMQRNVSTSQSVYVAAQKRAAAETKKIPWDEFRQYQEERGQWRLQQSRDALNRGDYEAAARFAQEVLELTDIPTSVGAEAQKRLRKAETYRAIAHQIRKLVEESEYYLSVRDYGQAVDILEQARWLNHEGKLQESTEVKKLLNAAQGTWRQALEQRAVPILVQARSTLVLAVRQEDCDKVLDLVNPVVVDLPAYTAAHDLVEEACQVKKRLIEAEGLKQSGIDAMQKGDYLQATQLLVRSKELNRLDPEVEMLVARAEQLHKSQLHPGPKPRSATILTLTGGLLGYIVGAAFEPVIQSWFRDSGAESMILRGIPLRLVLVLLGALSVLALGIALGLLIRHFQTWQTRDRSSTRVV